ncbi:oligopeptide transporter 2 [[Candida] anglica]|uniref:Oligopeptide transporter 2 n=1 Tax=[Candida] anglica TaxID=148631 RepID=A0ABP0E8G7_9ASCO
MTTKEGSRPDISSIKSGASRFEPEDHEVDLAAMISQTIAIGDVGISLSSEQKYYILRRLNYDSLVSYEDLSTEATFMIEKVENLKVPEALEILKETLRDYSDDFNFPTNDLDLIQKLVQLAPSHDGNDIKFKLNKDLSEDYKDQKQMSSKEEINVEILADSDSFEGHVPNYYDVTDWNLQVRLEAALQAYHSPYPEVRAISDPFDDPSIPCETLRAYVIGLIWVAIGVFINMFFSQRQPPISLSTPVVQLFLYPSGKLWEYAIPDFKIKITKNYSFRLNPGPWTYKEQMFATIMFSVSAVNAYISYNVYTQRVAVFYDNKWTTMGYQSLLVLSTNFLGFGFAGILRRFAVYPVKAIWPAILPTLALNRALLQPERKENINGWKISRYNFFFLVTGASFLYFWLPDYLFQALSTFNWMTWIAPDNFNLAMITGSVTGLGVNPIPSFDWNVLSFNAPLIVPFYTQVNQFIGMVIAFFVILGVWMSNNKWSGYIPVNSNSIFNNLGGRYSVGKVLNENGLLDEAKYAKYGPPYYSAANLVVYGAFFALYPFSVFYESITRWSAIKDASIGVFKTFRYIHRSGLEGVNDPHSRMMTRYKEVPEWCFLIILVISTVFAIVCVKVYPGTETPVWAIFFAIGINFVFLIPLTALVSSTGWGFGMNVLVELIVGYAIPGNSQALMFIKALGYNIDGQAQNYISDQKMAHYAKVPARAIFRGQLLSVILNSFIGIGVMNWQINSMPDICTPENSLKFTCPGATTYFSASVLWGTIGPKRVFGGLYPVMQYCFLIGFLMVPVALAFKWYAPKKYTKHFQPSIFIGGFLNWAPYNFSYFIGSMYLSIAFMYYIKKHYLTWWEKYNFVLSGALTAGVAFSSIIIFFAVQYHDKSISWWGNNVPYMGIDGGNGQQARLNVTESAPDGYFGLRIGHFP